MKQNSDYIVTTLNDAFDLQMGKTPSRSNSDFWKNGENNWVAISDLNEQEKYITQTKEYITNKAVTETGIKVVPKDTVIMSFKLSLGKVAITGKDMYTNEAIMAFNNSGKYDISTDYLYYLLKGTRWQEGVNKAVMGLTLNKKTLGEKKIKIPSRNIQNKVVKIFDKISQIEKSLQERQKTLDTLIKSRFVEMFGDPYDNPMCWLKTTMGNYISLITDFNANGSYSYLDSHVIMYDKPCYALMVRTTDLENEDFVHNVKYITEKAYHILEKSQLFGGEIIMNKIGSAGKVYLMPKLKQPASLGRNAFLIRYNEKINPKFLYHLLTSEYGTKEIMQYVHGAVTKTITKDDVRSVRIIVPPIELQNEFANFVQQVDATKQSVTQSIETLQTLKASLMQKYFH